MTSSDTTEGVVSPASRTVAPADWANALTFIVRGVNDNVRGFCEENVTIELFFWEFFFVSYPAK